MSTNSQDYIINPIIEVESSSYKPTLMAIGIASGSHSDGVAFDSEINSTYHISGAIDNDNDTFAGLISKSPNTGHTGFDIDLRKPYEVEADTATYNIIHGGKVVEYDPGAYDYYSWLNLFRLVDGNPNTFVQGYQIQANDQFGFEIQYDHINNLTGNRITRFELTPSSSDTLAQGYTASISFDGTTFIEDQKFTLDAVNTATEVNLTYGGDFDLDRGHQNRGNLDSKKIKKLRISSKAFSGSGTPHTKDIRFNELRVFEEKYHEPDGIFLSKINAKATFKPDDSAGDNVWLYQVSKDGDTFIDVGNVAQTNYAFNDYILSSSDYGPNTGEKVKKFRFVSTLDDSNERFYDLNIIQWGTVENDDILTNFEFNDSVLETKGWNSSRYDGRQLSAAKINEFTKGDITYGKTPVVERYTRNIYIGSKVVKLDQSGISDDTLLPFNDFSYIQTNYFITVNENGSITHNRLEDTDTKVTQKIGFYRSFYDDFPLDSTCNITILDNKAKNNLKTSYPIYFNGGQLRKLVEYNLDLSTQYIDENNVDDFYNVETFNIDTNNPIIKFTGYEDEDLNGDFERMLFSNVSILNEPLLRKFYAGNTDNPSLKIDEVQKVSSHIDFYDKAFEYKNSSNYINDKRFFFTFLATGSNTPIHTISTGSIPINTENALVSQDLGELSTFEIISASAEIDDVYGSGNGARNLIWHISSKSSFNQEYGTINYSGNTIRPQLAERSRIVISQLDDSSPSLLLPLNSTTELPLGPGDKPFIIIPNNLHPYIKDNLKLYLSKAGINVGDDATQAIEEIRDNKRRGPRLSPAQRRALARRQALAREQWMNRDSEKERRKEARQNRRKKRKENRQERREDRRENRQNRREDRRENRQNRKENRQEKRQGRKNRRKNRRKNK